MITVIPDLPNNTIGARYEGDVTGEDYLNVLWPAVSKAAETGDPVNIVVVFTEEMHHLSFTAMLSDGHLGMHFRKDWGRIAFVSDHEKLDKLVAEKSKPFGFEVRVFTIAEEQAAIDWAAHGEN